MGACGGEQRKKDMNGLSKLPLPTRLEEGAEKGVSGAFAGLLGDWLIYAGGCNFPAKGPLEGGSKRYYHRVYASRITSEGTEWRELGLLERPTAYGASVASLDADTLYFVGGTDGATALRTIYRFTLTADGEPQMMTLRDALPHGWYEGSAALDGDRLCLVGGWSEPGVPMKDLEIYDLTDGAPVLVSEVKLPDGARIQPVAFAHKGKVGVCGGFAPAAGGHGPVMQDRSYVLSLLDPSAGFRLLSDRPVLDPQGRKLLFVGSAVAYDGANGCVYVAGGVDYDIFRGAVEREYRQAQAQAAGDRVALKDFAEQRVEYMTREPEAYHFMPHVITLDYETGEWSVVATDTAFATAGAALAARDGEIYLVGGERKPGVRTSDIWRLKIKTI